jgi:hypothetical protein
MGIIRCGTAKSVALSVGSSSAIARKWTIWSA